MRHVVIATGIAVLAASCTGERPSPATSHPSARTHSPSSGRGPLFPSEEPPTNVRVTTDRAGDYLQLDGGADPTLESCGSSRRSQDEPSVAVDPRNPNIVVVGVNDACSEVVNGIGWVGLYRSTDGGRTWHPSLVPGYEEDHSSEGLSSPAHGRCNAASDPSLAFDRSGRLFYGFVCFKSGSASGPGAFEGVSTFVAVYGEGAARYVRTVLLSAGRKLFDEDKINVAVDTTSGPHAGAVYAAWDQLAPPTPGGVARDFLLLSRSVDHGQTFSPPRPVTQAAHAIFPDMSVAPDGTLYLAYQIENQFWVARSRDGGQHFNQTLVTDIVHFDSFQFGYQRRVCGDGPFRCRNGFTFPRFSSYETIAADRSGVHIAWSARIAGQAKIVSLNSSDGRTWSGRGTPVDDVSVGHQWFPDLASSDGVLTLAFYDSRADDAYDPYLPPGNTRRGKNSGPSIDVVAARSDDGGATWTERRVTTRSFNPNLETHMFGLAPFLGDYISAASVDGHVFVAWTDLRDVVTGVDRRENGKSNDHDGFDVYLPCPWDPLESTAKDYRRPFRDDPCLSKGGLDTNVYMARIAV